VCPHNATRQTPVPDEHVKVALLDGSTIVIAVHTTRDQFESIARRPACDLRRANQEGSKQGGVRMTPAPAAQVNVIVVDDDDDSDLVFEVKTKVEDLGGGAVDEQRMVCNGVQLVDDKTLFQQQVQPW
jgi:hypothetical protein